nr:MAG TPA: hypothetical protein [Caudoviricetes sp.]
MLDYLKGIVVIVFMFEAIPVACMLCELFFVR